MATTGDVPYPMSHDEWVDALEQRIDTLQKMLQEIAVSGVELSDDRMSYVVVQIPQDLWKDVQCFKAYKKEAR